MSNYTRAMVCKRGHDTSDPSSRYSNGHCKKCACIKKPNRTSHIHSLQKKYGAIGRSRVSASLAREIEIARINNRIFDICDQLDIAPSFERDALLREQSVLVTRKNALERKTADAV